MQVSKYCSKCKQDLDITLFVKNKSKKDGLSTICKPCKNMESKLRNAANPEKSRQRAKAYREKNPEKVKAQVSLWREKNKEHISEYSKEYYQQNKQEIKNKKRKYRFSNNTIKYNLEYLKKNIGKLNNFSERKFISFICKKFILKRDNYICQLCGSNKKLELHHILPIKQDLYNNFVNDPKNLITLCHDCHLNKAHNKSYKYLNEEIKTDLIKIAEEKELLNPTVLPVYDEVML